MIPKPSVSPDLAMAAEGQSMVSLAASGAVNNRVSPFGGGGVSTNQVTLAASHSIQNTNAAVGNGIGGKQLELGAAPYNARNLNV